jgi:phosphoribosylformimino-5-aminoimidazole carboxamide ribotide isomerase
MLRIIAVLDIKNGIAVHAQGGNRDHYAPLRSILHEGHDPLEFAQRFREQLKLETLYLADLDAIAGGPPNLALYRRISALPMNLWVDAGIRESQDAEAIIRCGALVIAGLETLQGPAALEGLIQQYGSDRIGFSLDLRASIPLVSTSELWGTKDPRKLADIAVKCGVCRLIVLDLARVGTNAGVGTLPLISVIRRDHPTLEIIAGGGVSGREDLKALEQAGASTALVGSALHNGRIGR